MVLHFCNDNHIILLQIISRPTIGNQVDCLSRSTRVNHIFRISSKVARNLASGFFQCSCCLIGQGMISAMSIGIVFLVISSHRVDYNLRLLRGSSVVKIDQFLAVGQDPIKDWKICSNSLDIQSHGFTS